MSEMHPQKDVAFLPALPPLCLSQNTTDRAGTATPRRRSSPARGGTMPIRLDVVLLLFMISLPLASSQSVWSNNEVSFLPADLLKLPLASSQSVWWNNEVSFLPADLLKTECGFASGSRKHKCTPPRFVTEQSSSLLWVAAVLSACAVLVLISSTYKRWSRSASTASAGVKAKMEAAVEPAAETEDAQRLQSAEPEEAECLQAADAELVRTGQGWFVSWRRRLEAAEAALTMRTAELAAEQAVAVVAVVAAAVEAVVVAAAKEELVTATAAAEAEAADAELRLEEAEAALAAREVTHAAELKAKQAFVDAAEEAIAATSAGAELAVDKAQVCGLT